MPPKRTLPSEIFNQIPTDQSASQFGQRVLPATPSEKKQSTPEPPLRNWRRATYNSEAFFRLLQLLARQDASGDQGISLAEKQEYQRLLEAFSVDTCDTVADGAVDSVLHLNAVEILRADCKPIPGDQPLICPRSEPRLPEALLPCVEQCCRDLGQIGPRATVLWVGRRWEPETMCCWDHGCTCFGLAERIERLGRVSAALVLEVRRLLGNTTDREAFEDALTRAEECLRLLSPVGTIFKSFSGPLFPSPELALAFAGLKGALHVLREQTLSEDSSQPNAARMIQILEKLETNFAEFVAEARVQWPRLFAVPIPALPVGKESVSAQPSETLVHCSEGPLRFEPGAFLYRGQREELSGKPLQVLEALAQARGNVLTLAELRDQCWSGVLIGEETIRSAVKSARAALRRAIQRSAVRTQGRYDPLPSADRGTGRTAWRLLLP